MARRTRTVNDDPENDGKPLALVPDDLREIYQPPVAQDFATEEEELASVLAEAGGAEGGGSIVVRKVNPQTRKYEWLIKFHSTADFISLGGVEHLAAKYGGGDYELIVYDSLSHIMKRPKLTISSAAVAEAKSDGGNVDRLVNVMLEGFKQLAAQQTQLAQQLQRPQETKADWLREMQMMREIFGTGQQQTDSLGSLAKLIPLVRDLMPRGEGETNMLDVFVGLAREFGPALRTAVEKTPALTAALAAPAQPGAPTLPPEQLGANQMQLMLKAQLAMLCNEAKNNSDPGPYAAIIVDKVSPEVLSNLVNNPDWLNELGKVYAGVKIFPKWFGELREAVIEEMTEPEPEEEHDPVLTGTENAGIQPGTDVEGIHVPGADE